MIFFDMMSAVIATHRASHKLPDCLDKSHHKFVQGYQQGLGAQDQGQNQEI